MTGRSGDWAPGAIGRLWAKGERAFSGRLFLQSIVQPKAWKNLFSVSATLMGELGEWATGRTINEL
jgi:hypothetical protein